jgi:two-component sensor histidine kinase
VLHELTTNAVKYGAWKNEGTVHVSWTQQDGTVILSWRESGAELTEMPERKGFGSLLMTSAARQFGGTFDRSFADDGLQVTIELPTDD